MRLRRSPSHRPERAGALIQELLAQFLREVRDPRVGFVTLTGVDVSPDLSHARVRVSVLGDDDDKARTLEGLTSAAGYLRTRVAQALPTRTSPELQFVLDRGLEHARRIDEVLREIKEDEG